MISYGCGLWNWAMWNIGRDLCALNKVNIDQLSCGNGENILQKRSESTIFSLLMNNVSICYTLGWCVWQELIGWVLQSSHSNKFLLMTIARNDGFQVYKGTRGRLIAYTIFAIPGIQTSLISWRKMLKVPLFFKRYLYSNYWAITDTLFETVTGSVQCRISAPSLVTKACKLLTTLQSMMNAKLSRQWFWHCHENRLIKAIQTIPHNLYVSVK